MMNRLKTSAGERLRSEPLVETTLPVSYAADAMRGAMVLGTDGRPYISVKIGGTYQWGLAVIGQSDGSVAIGVTAPISLAAYPSGSRTPWLQIVGETADTASQLVYGAGSLTPAILVARAGGNIAAPTVPGTLTCGQVSYYMYDGAGGFGQTSRVVGFAESATSGNTPGGVRVEVATSGNAVPNSEAVRVTSAGNVLIGNTTGTERLSVTGNIAATSSGNTFMVGGTAVVGSRKAGWGAATGTATRTTFATSTVTTTQLAERVKALIDDLISHGLIGA
jgi:hypothetical protein